MSHRRLCGRGLDVLWLHSLLCIAVVVTHVDGAVGVNSGRHARVPLGAEGSPRGGEVTSSERRAECDSPGLGPPLWWRRRGRVAEGRSLQASRQAIGSRRARIGGRAGRGGDQTGDLRLCAIPRLHHLADAGLADSLAASGAPPADFLLHQLGETQSAEPTLGDPCYGPANAHPRG